MDKEEKILEEHGKWFAIVIDENDSDYALI